MNYRLLTDPETFFRGIVLPEHSLYPEFQALRLTPYPVVISEGWLTNPSTVSGE